MDYQVVILAAGKGTRMGQNELPKVLVEMAGKPIIFYLLEEIKKIPANGKPIVVVGFKHNQVKDVLGNDCIYALQRDQLGTGHAAWSAASRITSKNIIVLYGDMPFIKAESLKKLARLHAETKAKLSMFTAYVPNFDGHFTSLNNYGRIIRDEFGNIVKITEYKDADEQERKLREVNPGIYMFNAGWLWDNIHHIQNKNAHGEYYLTDIVEVAMSAGEHIASQSINPKQVLGINTMEQLKTAERLMQTHVT